jgi:hypothetical protein
MERERVLKTLSQYLQGDMKGVEDIEFNDEFWLPP